MPFIAVDLRNKMSKWKKGKEIKRVNVFLKPPREDRGSERKKHNATCDKSVVDKICEVTTLLNQGYSENGTKVHSTNIKQGIMDILQ